MRSWRRLWFFLLSPFRRDRWEAEMAEEMRLHEEMEAEMNRAAGMSETDARTAARRSFGRAEAFKEISRDVRGIPSLDDIVRDLRYGARQLRHAPGFATVAVLTVALGIGSATVVFTVFNTAVLHPLAFPHPEELIAIHEAHPPAVPPGAVSPGGYEEFRRHATSFNGVAAWYSGPHNLTAIDDPVRAFTEHMSTNTLELLGVSPILGRDFRPDDGAVGAPRVGLLSYRLWQSSFGGSREVIGRVIKVDEEPTRIIGVLPPNFQSGVTNPAFYVPLIVRMPPEYFYQERFLTVVARLKPGVTMEQAATELAAIEARLEREHPTNNRGWQTSIASCEREVAEFARRPLFALLGAVTFLVLIACVNIANLLLARATSRQKEIALRGALGAGRGRVVRQLLCESLVLSALGGVVGVLLAKASLGVLLSVSPVDLPRLADIGIDETALAFGGGMVLLTGLGFGLAPAVQVSGLDPNQVLKDSSHSPGDGRRGRKLRSSLVVTEVALALVLLVGAALLGKSFFRMINLDRGYVPKGLYSTPIALLQRKYNRPEAAQAFIDRVLAEVKQVPGVDNACITILGLTSMDKVTLEIDGDSDTEITAGLNIVTREYLSTMQMPLVRGRNFSAADRMGTSGVVMVNRAFAKLHWPDRDPIGQRMRFAPSWLAPEPVWMDVVGLVGDTRGSNAYAPMEPQVFLSMAQYPQAWLSLGVRVAPGAAINTRAIVDAVHRVDKDVPIARMWELTTTADRGLPAVRRLSTVLATTFSVIALLLAAAGVYGVASYDVTQRTGEIGIRMALGASRGDVMRMILGQGGRMLAIALALGLGAAALIARALASQLYEVSPYDSAAFVGVPVLLVAVTLLALWIPAWRASRLNPLVAIRRE